MGKPAARVLDTPAHGVPPAMAPGPGSLNVLIGSKPAWRGVPSGTAAALQAAKRTSDASIHAAEAATAAAAGTPGLPAAKAAEEAAKATAAASMGSMITSMAAGADIHICAVPLPIPPHGPGVVVDGSTSVLINNLPACRLGDTIVEAVGPPDKIASGCMTVLIGTAAVAAPGLSTIAPPSAFDRFTNWFENLFRSGDNQVELYGRGISIQGTPEFRLRTRMALDALAALPSGSELLHRIGASGHSVNITETNAANGFCRAHNGADSRNGTGTDSTISWNPDHNTTDAADPATGSPGSTVVLGHELVHSMHNAEGNNHNGPNDSYPGQDGSSARGEERATVGAGGTSVVQPDGTNAAVPDHSHDHPTENSIRDDLGIARRPTYYPSNWPGGAPW